MSRPRLPLPTDFEWRRWHAHHIRFHQPGDPAPDAVIFELIFRGTPVARIQSMENDAHQWWVAVNAGMRKRYQQHAVAVSEEKARDWCERWAMRELARLSERYTGYGRNLPKGAYSSILTK
ncbi:hypothetical protein ACI2IY_12670 [Lysobacter enzymogenes]|uniref:hypothetical protein n=1 Tax=Lysobacter enzymogenes TaxID=69 RepID=UPI00384EF2AA